jgi:transcription elongation factor Elf1
MNGWRQVNFVEAIATIIGVCIIAVGLLLSRETGTPGTLGTILGILGTCLSSAAAAWSFGRAAAESKITEQLQIVRGQLATASAQIGRAVERGVHGSEQPALSFARIEQGVNSLSNVVRDLGRLIGDELENENLAIIEAKQTLAALGAGLEVLSDNAQKVKSPDIDVQRAIEDLQQKVSASLAILDQASPNRYIKENVICPYCRTVNNISIGIAVGSTATASCSQCGGRFNVHRGSGGVFVRSIMQVWPSQETQNYSDENLACPGCSSKLSVSLGTSIGSTASAYCAVCDKSYLTHRTALGITINGPYIRINSKCPECSEVVTVNHIDDGSREVIRFCLSCFSKIAFDVQSREPRLISKQPPLEAEKISSQLLRCPSCGGARKTFAQRNGVVYAVCQIDDRLLKSSSMLS